MSGQLYLPGWEECLCSIQLLVCKEKVAEPSCALQTSKGPGIKVLSVGLVMLGERHNRIKQLLLSQIEQGWVVVVGCWSLCCACISLGSPEQDLVKCPSSAVML